MKERVYIWISKHLPKELVYWCGIRVVFFGTTGKYSNQVIQELSVMKALERFYYEN